MQPLITLWTSLYESCKKPIGSVPGPRSDVPFNFPVAFGTVSCQMLITRDKKSYPTGLHMRAGSILSA